MRRRPVQWARGLPSWVFDGVLAAVLAFGSSLTLVPDARAKAGLHWPTLWLYVVVVLTAAPTILRRRFPMAVLVGPGAVVIALSAFEYPVGALPFAILIGMYSVAVYADRRRSVQALAFIYAGLVVLWVVHPIDFGNADFIQNVIVFTGVWFFADNVATRRKYLAELEEKAARLERERGEQAAKAVADERLRIAQELHDVVAHAMSVIAVQSGVGAHVIDTQPDKAKEALQAVEATSRAALQEMRRMLGVLRQEGDRGGALEPAVSLGDFERLVVQVRATGMPVDLQFDGDPNEYVPESVRLNEFRVMQEALTNVVKHAGRASVVVTIGRRPGCTWVEVVDDGRGLASARSASGVGGGGAGLLGMRERVALFGGRLETGPRPGGGFRVYAWFPFDESATSANEEGDAAEASEPAVASEAVVPAAEREPSTA